MLHYQPVRLYASSSQQGAVSVNVEMLPGLDNVVRFPIELRVAPSMEVIYEIEPDCREVFRVAESFKVELPDPDLANQVDAETAIYIAEQILPLTPSEQKAALGELLDPVVRRAVHACRFMDRVSKQSVQAELALLQAQTDGGCYHLPSLEEKANALSNQAAELLILAYARCREAHGAQRAISLAQRGETWTPYSAKETTEWLIEAGRADQARIAALPA